MLKKSRRKIEINNVYLSPGITPDFFFWFRESLLFYVVFFSFVTIGPVYTYPFGAPEINHGFLFEFVLGWSLVFNVVCR